MRRLDASMSLLTDIEQSALEPEYREVANSGGVPRSPWILGLTVLALGALLTLAVTITNRNASSVDSERAALITRIEEQRTTVSTLEGRASDLEAEVRDLRDSQANDPTLRTQLDELGAVTGGVAVKGPGIVITADDAPDGSEAIYDSDLSRLVNGLREAGAEAVAINGRRVSALTPIRTAGSAITVDYVSLTPPYRIEALGDPATIGARFARTSAASWWAFIRDNYGVIFTISVASSDLELPADPGMSLRYADR